MLRVDLGQLRREGSLPVEARVPADDGLWKDSGLVWDDSVDVRLTASFAGTGELIVRGHAEGVLAQECRRCLQPVTTDVAEDLTLVFIADPESDEVSGGDAYPFEAAGVELDLGSAVREELILAVNPYVVCDLECRGLCPKCGANRNEDSCDCAEDEADPRWEALRVLKDK